MSKPIERCRECDDPTGRAGRGDDSLYCDSLSCDDGTGPFCEDCFEKHRRAVHDTSGEL